MIIEIWQQVLGFSEIEREDNFFDLGGYSLLMIRVQRQIQEMLQVQIPLTDLLRFPTVQSMAAFLSQGFDTESALVRRRERGRARDEALSRQRTRRQALHSSHGGSDE
jgi:acyl carrier protein